MSAGFYQRTAPHVGVRTPYHENHPMMWDQEKLQQEPKWEGALAAFGATHGAKSRDELERKLAAYGGTKVPAEDILAMAKGIGKDWKGDHVMKPKLELQHSDSSEHVPFTTFLAQYLKEYGVVKLMHLRKETLPNEVRPISKWVPKRGQLLSAAMPESTQNSRFQNGGYAMEALGTILYGGAAGTSTSGRSLVGIQMQTHPGGPASFKVKRLSDTLEIEFRGAYTRTNGPNWWFRVQMVFLENKMDETGVDKAYRGKPFLWVDMDFVRHGCREYVEPGRVWRDVNRKLTNYVLLRARDVNDHHGIRNDFPSFAAGAMRKKWEEVKETSKRSKSLMLLNFNANGTLIIDTDKEATEDADRWYAEFMIGSRTVEDEDDGTQVPTARIDQAPLEMLLNSVQESFYRDRAKREKAEGFDLAREQKRRENTERRMWEHIERETRLLNKASKKRKKSTGGKGPRKMRKQPPKQGSLVESVECATEGLARASPNQESVTNVLRAPTVNEPAGTLSMEGSAGEQEPNAREPSDGASSA